MTKACFPFFFNKKTKSKLLNNQEIIACMQIICEQYTYEPFPSINNFLTENYSESSNIQLSEKDLFILVSIMSKAREPFEDVASMFSHLNGHQNKNAFLAWRAQQLIGIKNSSEKVKKVISSLQENSIGTICGWRQVVPQDFAKILRGKPTKRKESTYITTEKSSLLQFCCIQPSPGSITSSRATSPAGSVTSSRAASPLLINSEDIHVPGIGSPYSTN